jgi:hypothetical protein
MTSCACPVIFAVLALTIAPVEARIGETLEQCVSRYGEPVSKANGLILFQKSGIVIAVASFFEGRVDSIGFKKISGDPLSATELKELLDANSGGQTWKKGALGADVLLSQDGELTAKYTDSERTLVIATVRKLARDAAKSESKQLNGF